MSRNWRWVLPCYLFTLPATMVSFVIAAVFYRARNWKWYDGVLTCVAGRYSSGVTRIWGRAQGQTIGGWLQVYESEELRNCVDLRVHETVHVVQAFALSLAGVVVMPFVFALIGSSSVLGLALGGFLGALAFAVLYGALFLVCWAKQGFGHWYYAYLANPFEAQAYRIQDKYIADPTTRPWGV